ncbi:hypothetical protein RHGRI_017541 [Rhododendron griersonianum]|uniref:Uncharacterized protein n=1 Tax=Rhododendron griersonianum TaxID=479676 RepID=A0AAV6JY59_9ERIC|nr:hypothetical protein RHGRI_017541 [Rhododendron griersonianum]
MVVVGMEPEEPEEDGGNVEGDGKKMEGTSGSPSPTWSSEKPLTKSTHIHLSVIEGVTGGREIIVDAVAAEIADDTEEVDDGKIDELYVGMKKSARAATKGLGKS